MSRATHLKRKWHYQVLLRMLGILDCAKYQQIPTLVMMRPWSSGTIPGHDGHVITWSRSKRKRLKNWRNRSNLLVKGPIFQHTEAQKGMIHKILPHQNHFCVVILKICLLTNKLFIFVRVLAYFYEYLHRKSEFQSKYHDFVNFTIFVNRNYGVYGFGNRHNRVQWSYFS